jgi:hypothetical protein
MNEGPRSAGYVAAAFQSYCPIDQQPTLQCLKGSVVRDGRLQRGVSGIQHLVSPVVSEVVLNCVVGRHDLEHAGSTGAQGSSGVGEL